MNSSAVPLVYDYSDDSVEGRGAGWLFMEYLIGRFGQEILRELVQSTDESVTNVENRTGLRWHELVRDWQIALYADDAPELSGVRLDARYTFPQLNLRVALSSVMRNGEYPLQPVQQGASDFVLTGSVATSSAAYVLLQATGTTQVGFSGLAGRDLPEAARAGLTVLRVR
jgi:hypothetical protein